MSKTYSLTAEQISDLRAWFDVAMDHARLIADSMDFDGADRASYVADMIAVPRWASATGEAAVQSWSDNGHDPMWPREQARDACRVWADWADAADAA